MVEKSIYCIGAIESAFHVVNGFSEVITEKKLNLKYPRGFDDFLLHFIDIGETLNNRWRNLDRWDGVFDYDVSYNIGRKIPYLMKEDGTLDMDQISNWIDFFIDKYQGKDRA